MHLKLRNYELEDDVEVKVIPDGYEIFADAVKSHNIDPTDFASADWTMGGGIIVYTV